MGSWGALETKQKPAPHQAPPSRTPPGPETATPNFCDFSVTKKSAQRSADVNGVPGPPLGFSRQAPSRNLQEAPEPRAPGPPPAQASGRPPPKSRPRPPRPGAQETGVPPASPGPRARTTGGGGPRKVRPSPGPPWVPPGSGGRVAPLALRPSSGSPRATRRPCCPGLGAPRAGGAPRTPHPTRAPAPHRALLLRHHVSRRRPLPEV